jgi:hypothetical protein
MHTENDMSHDGSTVADFSAYQRRPRKLDADQEAEAILALNRATTAFVAAWKARDEIAMIAADDEYQAIRRLLQGDA